MQSLRPIHPFPARMASEIAFKEIKPMPSGSLILDPMVGSGTTVRVATELGHRAIGFDVDPLAILMSRVFVTPIDTKFLSQAAEDIVSQAKKSKKVELPWIDEDSRTKEFINFWFAAKQRQPLRKLAYCLHQKQGKVGDALRIALSRTIITTKGGASLAWDSSHSRPHRVSLENDFLVYDGFLKSVNRLVNQLNKQPPQSNAKVYKGDARKLNKIADESVDAVLTSPPYLNAISYLSGHRLSLVWLGHSISDLSSVNTKSIGSRKLASGTANPLLIEKIAAKMGDIEQLSDSQQRMIKQYVLDMFAIIEESWRVLRPGGKAVFIIGDSCLRSVPVMNSEALKAISRATGFMLKRRHIRELEPNRRYLPPPSSKGNTDLEKRMRFEHVLTFEK
jgi:DNA modification methylase